MKHFMITIFALFTGAIASADGFVCNVPDDSGRPLLRVSVYNHTDASMGTRTPAVMVVSDLTVSAGRKTVATFTSDNETLWLDSDPRGSVFVGNVDLRYSETGRGGEVLLGTKLSNTDTVRLLVGNYFYGSDSHDGQEYPGLLIVNRRDGETVTAWADCVRYLKGE